MSNESRELARYIISRLSGIDKEDLSGAELSIANHLVQEGYAKWSKDAEGQERLVEVTW